MKRLVMIVIAAFAAACASAPPPAGETAAAKENGSRYGREAGESTVGVIPDAVVPDEARKRDIQLAIDYPTRAVSTPVIIFSHAVGASELAYSAYASHWASHGYVVIRVGHEDAVRGMHRQPDATLVEGTPAEWVRRAHERARDLKLVIDALPTLHQQYPELAGKMDVARIGVGGHAFGSLAAMLTGGVRTSPDLTVLLDPRVKAIVAMSPPGTGERRGLVTESFRTLTAPTLFLTGTLDAGGDETEPPAWRREGFDAAAPGDKWLVSLTGAGKNTFSGLLMDEPVKDRPDLTDPRYRADPNLMPDRRNTGEMGGLSRSVLAHARSITLAFWDAYLRDDAAGRELLTGVGARGWGEVTQK